MVHIRNAVHGGVEYAIEYDPETKKFSTLLPFKRVRIEGRTEWDVTRDAKKEIDSRKRRKKRVKPKITFFGGANGDSEPMLLTYEGIDLRSGDVTLKKPNGVEVSSRFLKPVVYPMAQQGRLAMAYATYKAAKAEWERLSAQHGKKVEMPYTQSYGDARDRSARNLKAEEVLTQRIRDAL